MAYVGSAGSSNSNAALNTPMQNILLKREKEQNTYFTRMTSDMSLYKAGDTVRPGVVFRASDFVTKGGDEVRIPFLKKLSGEPQYGDIQSRGNEEKQAVRYFPVKINKIKKSAMTEGEMSDFRVKRLQLQRQLRPQLSQYMASEIDFEHFRALTRGYSNNLLAEVADGGAYVNAGVQKSHPNLFCAGLGSSYSDSTQDGLVKWDETDSTYEGYVADALNNMPEDSDGKFSLLLLDRLIPQLQTMGIEPLTIDGEDMYVCLIHTQQWQQIAEEGGKLFQLLEKIDSGLGKKSAIFTGAKYKYKNFIFHVNQNVPGVTTSGSTITYGLASGHSRDAYDKKCGFILGNGALGYGIGRNARFESELIDYGSFTGVESSEISGVQRTDWKRDDGVTSTSRIGENISSLEFVTYSPLGAFTSA